MYSVILSSYTNTRESLRELGKLSPVFVYPIETRYMSSYFLINEADRRWELRNHQTMYYQILNISGIKEMYGD